LALLQALPSVEAQVGLVFREMDENADGIVDREEFMLSTRDELDAAGKEDKEMRKMAFRFAGSLYDICDIDEDGVLQPLELDYCNLVYESAASTSARKGKHLAEFVMSDVAAKALLQHVDTDADGSADFDEFVAAARTDLDAWGWQDHDPHETGMNKLLDQMFGMADIDGDGVLTARELHFAGALVSGYVMHEFARTLLHDLDKNSDGRVEWDEVVESLRNSTPKSGQHKTLKEHIRDEFFQADLDGDLTLDAQELYFLSSGVLRSD